MDIRKVRRFLDIRQIDISAATGLTVHTISLAERGCRIDIQHRRVLERFLAARLRSELGSDRDSADGQCITLSA